MAELASRQARLELAIFPILKILAAPACLVVHVLGAQMALGGQHELDVLFPQEKPPNYRYAAGERALCPIPAPSERGPFSLRRQGQRGGGGAGHTLTAPLQNRMAAERESKESEGELCAELDWHVLVLC